VRGRRRRRAATLCFWFAGSALAGAQQGASAKLDAIFQTAVSEYNAGQFTQAAAHLEVIEPSLSNHFEVEELLGLVYASMSEDAKALTPLEAAVRLKPDSAAAHTNLAASLARLGRRSEAGEQFRKALAINPKDYSANHDLGEFYVQSQKLAEGIPYLEQAQKIKPSAYDNGYDLATAELLAGQTAKALAAVASLEKLKDTGELHNLAGQIDEKDGRFVAAANEFETAAHMDPSEPNLFDWGTELLLHRTYEPAIDVFRAAAQRYPNSARVLIGLGMTLYARGLYEDAVKALLAAADLNPADPRCYLFLSRAYDSSPNQADEVIQRFQRYAELEPKNARAQYYYAMSLWKGKRVEAANVDVTQIEALLKASIALDDTIADAHLQLGNLYAGQHHYEQAVPEYQRALALDPSVADAHYRLATGYTRLGDKARAQAEYALYQDLRSKHMAELDKERAEVQQFVYSSKAESPAPAKP